MNFFRGIFQRSEIKFHDIFIFLHQKCVDWPIPKNTSQIRVVSRIHRTSKMAPFKTLVKGFRPLPNPPVKNCHFTLYITMLKKAPGHNHEKAFLYFNWQSRAMLHFCSRVRWDAPVNQLFWRQNLKTVWVPYQLEVTFLQQASRLRGHL